MDESVPAVFDWVTARSKCSLKALFRLLVEVVESDTAVARGGLVPHAVEVKVNRLTEQKILVSVLRTVSGFAESSGVMLELQSSDLVVTAVSPGGASDKALFTGSARLWPDGQCRFEVNGHPLELWQVSQRALEHLFFP
jgi:hypothetical protein